jgi:CRISPR-associated protein Cmr5
METRSQKYAVEVYKRVAVHKGKSTEQRTKYGIMAHKLPVLIRTAGLAQAISFLETKTGETGGETGEEMNKQLLEDLSSVVSKVSGIDIGGNLPAKCREAELQEYIRLTKDTLDALLWFKRYSVSVLEVKNNANE